MQCNKGISSYKTKEHLLSDIIVRNSIDIAYISEANITKSYLSNNYVINDYDIETKPMHSLIYTGKFIEYDIIFWFD